MIEFRDFIESESAGKPHYLVVGHPIGHSLSPLMHQAALDHHRIPAAYIAVDLEPGEIDRFVAWLNREQFLGANVTLPHKQAMMRVVDRLDPAAEEIGALNTIVKRNGEIWGFNTDVPGFIHPLKEFEELLNGALVIVFGSGGASRAVIAGLRKLGVREVVTVSRNPGRLGEEYANAGITLCNYENWQAYAGDAALLVNTTPLGMYPATERSPVRDSEISILSGKICYDLVYNPLRTTFLKQAEVAGGITVGGLEMFIRQGDESFRLWTGKTFPAEKVRNALKPELT